MTEEYIQYLNSDHWKNLRKQAIEKWGDRCCNCSVPQVDIHHLNYSNLYDVTTDDLMPLCRRCHDNVHSNPKIYDLIKSDTTSEQKRIIVISFLTGLDAAITAKVKHQPKSKILKTFKNTKRENKSERKKRKRLEKKRRKRELEELRLSKIEIKKAETEKRKIEDDKFCEILHSKTVEGEFVIITTENLEKLKTTKGGYTRATLTAIGLGQYIPKNWRQRILGLKISMEKWEEAMKGKEIYVPVDLWVKKPNDFSS